MAVDPNIEVLACVGRTSASEGSARPENKLIGCLLIIFMRPLVS